MNSEKTTLEFEYNADGIRTKKIVTTTSDHVHTFQDAVTQPKCTENGYTTHTCICGYIYQDSPVPATGHDFTTTVVGTNCTEVGHTVYTCACGYSYEDGSNGHNFTALVIEPSETVNGFTLHQCDCGYSYESDPVASLAGTDSSTEVVSDTKVYDYVYNGSTLTQLTITTTIHAEGTTTEELYFTYDGSSPMSVTYNGEIFYYVTNLQGDVIAILDSNGVAVVTYSYDAWGNILEIGGSKKDTLGVANPLTYRGYVYDAESGLYYLQSRYYNPEIGRFINADGLISAGGLLGYNMFAYCSGNPVSFIDASGFSKQFFSARTFDQSHTGGTGGGVILLPTPSLIRLLEVAQEAVTVIGAIALTQLVKDFPDKGNGRTYSVYFLQDSTGVVRYVGRVTDSGYEARMNYHKATRNLEPKLRISGLSYNVARGLEEIGMIECHTLNAFNPQNNQIHGIGIRNRDGEMYMIAAIEYLQNRAENALLDILSY